MNSEVTVKLGRSEEPIRDLSLAKQIKEAHELDTESKKLSAKLAELKKKILEKARAHISDGADTITFIKDGSECKVVFGKTKFIDPGDVAALREELKSTFDVLIEHTDAYKPTKKFLEYAEGKPEVEKLISEKDRSPRVVFSVLKDKEAGKGGK